jgi:hypothetical protein
MDAEMGEWTRWADAVRSLNLCGCGNPDAAYQFLLDTLSAFDRSDSWEASCERIREWWAVGEGPGYLVLYFLTNADLLEHGGSVGGSWLTPKGKDALNCLRSWGVDPDHWPEQTTN